MALEQFLAMDPLINPHQATFIVEATKFCLTHNYFTFDGEYYLQQQGTAMGANFAPSICKPDHGLLGKQSHP